MPPRANTKRQRTIVQSLTDLGILATSSSSDQQVFEGCSTRDEEFRVLKKHYYKQCLQHHPDKGGDAAIFRKVQTAFELLRDLHTGKQQRRKTEGGEWLFSECWNATSAESKAKYDGEEDENDDEAFDMSDYDFSFSQNSTEMPSWEYYQEAAEELVPPYRIELAKSGRSKCTQTGRYKKCQAGLGSSSQGCTDLVDTRTAPELIAKNEVRVGWINEDAGSYGGWKHLRCWRVPHKVRAKEERCRVCGVCMRFFLF
jgi:hypothetical protein